MAKQQVIILVSLIAILYGCSRGSKKDSNKQYDFYSNYGGWDWVRIPLINPYEIKKANPKTNRIWDIEFLNSFGTYNVKKVAVQDSIIYILSGRIDEKNDSTIVNSENVSTAWFVIDSRIKMEKGFSKEEEFYSYIKEKKFLMPQWHDVDSLLISLENNGKLPWMPKLLENKNQK